MPLETDARAASSLASKLIMMPDRSIQLSVVAWSFIVIESVSRAQEA